MADTSKKQGRETNTFSVNGMAIALSIVSWLVLLLVTGMLLSSQVLAQTLAPRMESGTPLAALSDEMRGELHVTGRLLTAPCLLSTRMSEMTGAILDENIVRVMVTLEGCGDRWTGTNTNNYDVSIPVTFRWGAESVFRPARLVNGMNHLLIPQAQSRVTKLEIRYE